MVSLRDASTEALIGSAEFSLVSLLHDTLQVGRFRPFSALCGPFRAGLGGFGAEVDAGVPRQVVEGGARLVRCGEVECEDEEDAKKKDKSKEKTAEAKERAAAKTRPRASSFRFY